MRKMVDVDNKTADDILALLSDDSELILVKRNSVVAHIKPLNSVANRRIPDLHLGAMMMTEDFDEPLNDSFWLGNI